jgi:hypothetical protein
VKSRLKLLLAKQPWIEIPAEDRVAVQFDMSGMRIEKIRPAELGKVRDKELLRKLIRKAGLTPDRR